jgi:hypothetical protein
MTLSVLISCAIKRICKVLGSTVWYKQKASLVQDPEKQCCVSVYISSGSGPRGAVSNPDLRIWIQEANKLRVQLDPDPREIIVPDEKLCCQIGTVPT